MSVEKDTLLFEVVVDLKETESNTKKATDALARLRSEKEKTQKLFDSKQLGEEVYRKVMQALTVEIDKTEKELSGYTKTLDTHQKQQKAAEGIIKQMSTSIATMGTELGSLNDVQQASIQSSAELAAHVKALSVEWRMQESIAKAMAGSMDDLDKLTAELDASYHSLSKAQREDATVGGILLIQINQLNKAQEANQKTIDESKKGIKEYIRDTDLLGVNIGATIDSFKSGVKGIQLFTQTVGVGRAALIALTAVPIILLLSGLYVILTKSQKGMDFLAKATSGVSAIFSAFTGKVIAIGEALANAWENPKQGIADFGKFVQQNLINRFTALGVIIDGIRNSDWGKVGDGLIQLGTGAQGAATGLKKAYDQGVAMEALSISIKENEIKLNTERAKSEKLIERQKQIAEDTTKSIEVRKKAEQAALAESVRIQGKEQALQKQRIKLAQDQEKADQGNREARAKVAEEQAKYEEIATDRLGERTEMQNQLNSIEAEGAQKALENAKKRAEADVAEAETALLQAKRKGEGVVAIEQEILKRQLDLIDVREAAEKAGVEKGIGYQQQIKLIEEKAIDERIDAAKTTALKIADIAYKTQITSIETSLALTQKGSEQELNLHIKAINAERNRQLAEAKRTITDQEKLLDEEQRINLTAARASGEARFAFEQSEINRRTSLSELRLQVELALGDQSLAHDRKIAADRIDLEEKTQKELLDLELKYGQISSDDYLTRLNALQAKALSARGDLERQLTADSINDYKARSESQLALSKAGSKEELNARINGIHAERIAALNVAKLTADQRKAINDKANREIADAEDEHRKQQILKIVDGFSQATSAIGNAINASIDAQSRAIDDQEKAALSSAALSAEAREAIEANFQKKREKLEKQAAEKKKKIALVEAAIGTARSIIEASPDPFLMALAAAVGALQIGVISSQQFAKGGVVDTGGVVNGPSHAQGGIGMFHKSGHYLGEMEGKEIILTKGVYNNPALRAEASALNVKGGGRAFADAMNQFNRSAIPTYTPVRMEYGGVTSQPYAQQAQQSAIDFDGLNRVVSQAVVAGVAQAVSSMPNPVVDVKDVVGVAGKRQRVIAKADS